MAFYSIDAERVGTTMSYQSVRTRQIVDWGAAIRAGFIAGFFFLLANLVFMALSFGANGWVLIRQLASILLGEGILAPPAAFDAVATIVALLVHFALSVGYALLIAYVIHRGGMITGIVGGALLGVAFYAINVYTLTVFYPWLFALRNGVFLASHVLFGALAGGIYEALEEEIFVAETDNETEVVQ
jgi:hypothetical protein